MKSNLHQYLILIEAVALGANWRFGVESLGLSPVSS